jgi:hypothetical protein
MRCEIYWVASVNQRGGECTVQALFDHSVQGYGRTLEVALNQFRATLAKHLQKLSQSSNQRMLRDWLDVPEFKRELMRVRLTDGLEERAGTLCVVQMTIAERGVAFIPNCSDFYFDFSDGEGAERVASVFNQRLKAEVKRSGYSSIEAVLNFAEQTLRFGVMELEFSPARGFVEKQADPRDPFGGQESEFNGAQELNTTGILVARERDSLASVDRGALRRIDHALSPKHFHGVALIGAAGSGKTTLLRTWLSQQEANDRSLEDAGEDEEFAEHALEPARTRKRSDLIVRRVWLLSPLRLISGMSYLGQWEARLHAILRHAAERDLVLYFDDPLGLLSAGKSSGSELCLADVILPYLRENKVRAVLELLPDAWRILRERNREFAESFEPIQVHPLDRQAMLPIIAKAARSLERETQVRFELPALQMVLDLAERLDTAREFPGKAVDTLRAMAARVQHTEANQAAREFSPGDVLGEYARRFRLNRNWLAQGSEAGAASVTTTLSSIDAALARDLRGQAHARASIANKLLQAQLGLNDPKRPLGVMLLLGPSGVGKTQCAKAVARFLGDERTLLRFDMNEFGEARDAQRLVGSLQNPDGLLTQAIRMQPCSVVLLDEIEKAAPEVFDVLLSLLDEGRLTDGFGRVADFRQAFIFLTSNLGAREASSELGFVSASARDRSLIYRDAAQRFFRPEFFNRLDDVIGFAPFSDAELREIANLHLNAAFARSGLQARSCIVTVDPDVEVQLARAGHDASLGARTIKRAIEEQVMTPLARQLLQLDATQTQAINAPKRIHLRLQNQPNGSSVVRCDVSFIEKINAAKREEPNVSLLQLQAWLDAERERFETISPTRLQTFALDSINPQAQHYFAVRECFQSLQNDIETLVAQGNQSAVSKRLSRITVAPRSLNKKRGGTLASQRRDLSLQLQNDSSAEQALEFDPIDAQSQWMLRARWLQSLLSHTDLEHATLTWKRLPEAKQDDMVFEWWHLILQRCVNELPGLLQLTRGNTEQVLQLTGYGLRALLAPLCVWTLDCYSRREQLAGFELSIECKGEAVFELSPTKIGFEFQRAMHSLALDDVIVAHAEDAVARLALSGLSACEFNAVVASENRYDDFDDEDYLK